MGPTWGPPGSCRPQMGPMLAPWTLLSGYHTSKVFCAAACAKLFWSKVNVLFNPTLYFSFHSGDVLPSTNYVDHIDDLVQNCSISIANTMGSRIKQSICWTSKQRRKSYRSLELRIYTVWGPPQSTKISYTSNGFTPQICNYTHVKVWDVVYLWP